MASVSNQTGVEMGVNDATLSKWKFTQTNALNEEIVLDTVSCNDLINSWIHLSETERAVYIN